MSTFTKDDVGKAVETAEGEQLGVVSAVDRETAYVEPDPGIADSVRAALGWGGASDDAVPLADSAVRESTDDAIRLAETVPEDAFAPGDGGPDERSGGGGPRDVEGSRGDPVDPLGSETRADVGERRADEPAAEGGVEEAEPDAEEAALGGPESGATGPDRRPESEDAGEPEFETDRVDDVAEGGAGTDAAEEIDGDAERRNADGRPSVEEMDPVGEMDGPDEMDSAAELDGPERMDPLDEASGAEEMEPVEEMSGSEEMTGAEDTTDADEMTDADELDSVESAARRDLEVDPTELTNRDPEVEVRPDENVGTRTDAEVDPDDLRGDVGGPTTEDAPDEERTVREDEGGGEDEGDDAER